MKRTNNVLIWDFDGTLAYRAGGWAGALLSVLQNAAPELDATDEAVRPFLQSGFPWHAPENVHPGLNADEWWEELVPLFARAFRGAGLKNGKTLELAYQVRDSYLNLNAWHRYEDTLPTLEALTKRGWTHVLLTNHVPELPCLLDYLGLSGKFAQVFNSALTGIEKPNPKAFRTVMDWAGPEATTWVIGDSYSADYVGAHENCLKAILVRKPHPAATPFCQTLDQLLEIL